MTENGSESLPFEPPEQENIRLREENARLRRLLAVPAFRFRNSRQRIRLQPKPSRRRQRWTRMSAPERGSRCSAACFAGEKMSTPGDGRIMTVDTDIRPLAVSVPEAVSLVGFAEIPRISGHCADAEKRPASRERRTLPSGVPPCQLLCAAT